jgi:hypothetical protein
MIRFAGSYKELKQAGPDDPSSFFITQDFSEMPMYVKFEQGAEGNIKSIILGMNRYVKKKSVF